MTTTVTANGAVVLPRKVRQEKKLRVGDELEVLTDEDEPNVIMLRRVQKSPNEGLLDVLRACPVKGFRIPNRSKELPRDVKL